MPEPPSADALVARARDLIPALRARAADCEAARRLPAATLADFLDAGFFRILQPRRCGGFEHELGVLARVVVEVARGCGASAWVLSLTAAHNWWAAKYPPQAQQELFAADGDLRFPLIFAPQGTARPADGGYRLDGRWNYATGCDVGNWLGVNALAPDGPVVCLVRQADYTVYDNWHVMGLRGSGSKQAVLADVFVPAHRALSLRALEADGSPGAALHDNPFYRGPAGPVFMVELAAVAVGIGRGAIDAYEARARERTSAFSPGRRLAEAAPVQRRLARAVAAVDAAEALLLDRCAAYMARVRETAPAVRIPLAERLRWQLDMQLAVGLAAGAVDGLFVGGGTSAMNDGEALQRCFRDISALRTHYLLDPDRDAESWGRVTFGLEPLARMPGL